MSDIPLPQNLGLLIPIATNEQAELLEKILKGQMRQVMFIIEALSKHWPIKIWFSESVCIHRPRRYVWSKPDENGCRTGWCRSYNEGTEYIFKSGFWINTGRGILCYCIKRHSSRGYVLNMNKVVKYEPVIKRTRS